MTADLGTKADLAAAVQELRAEMRGMRGDLFKMVVPGCSWCTG